MCVRMKRTGKIVDEQGMLETTVSRDGRMLQTVTIFAKYLYVEHASGHDLARFIVACITNGQL